MVNATTNVTNTQTRKGTAIAYNPLDKKTPIRARPGRGSRFRIFGACWFQHFWGSVRCNPSQQPSDKDDRVNPVMTRSDHCVQYVNSKGGW